MRKEDLLESPWTGGVRTGSVPAVAETNLPYIGHPLCSVQSFLCSGDRDFVTPGM